MPQALTPCQRIKDTGAITLGYRENSIPMSYADAHQPMGFALDLCAGAVSKVKQKLGLAELRIDYQAVTQAEAAALLATGAMAIDCAATPTRAELAQQAAFSEPVFVSELRWIAPRRLRVEREGRRGTRYETISPATAEDLKGKPVALTQGAGVTSLVLTLSSDRSLGPLDRGRQRTTRNPSSLSKPARLRPSSRTICFWFR